MVAAVVILSAIAAGLGVAIVYVARRPLDAVPVPVPVSEPAEAPRPSYVAQRLRILVVDANPFIGRTVTRLLDGHDVAMATSGEAALSALAIDDDRDAVLCALAMPGMSGQQFAAALAQRHPELRARLVFLVNAGATSETRGLLARSDVRCITKPLGYVQLATCVSEIAAQRTAAAA